MARITTRRPEEDEEDMIEEIEGDEESVSAPAVSDSRRRRKMKRGESVSEEVAEQPARKERTSPRADEKSSNFIVRAYENFIEYLRDVQSELNKVSWLSREDTLRLSYIVLIVTAIAAIFLGFVGFMFALLTQSLASGSVVSAALTIGIIVAVSGMWLFRDRFFSNID
jgi:preprotein translocase SecE subunit